MAPSLSSWHRTQVGEEPVHVYPSIFLKQLSSVDALAGVAQISFSINCYWRDPRVSGSQQHALPTPRACACVGGCMCIADTASV